MDLVHWISEPRELRQPVLLVALEGFVDAGSVASSAAMFLRHRWQSMPLARFNRDVFLDYRARRPTAVVDSGEIRRVEWPELELLGAAVPDAEQDALLLIGPEPDMRWNAWVEQVCELAQQLEVAYTISLGAYPAAAPHTRPVSIVAAENAAAENLAPDVPRVSSYTGPVGADLALHTALAERDMPSVGLWAEVPHYIATNPYPPGSLAMVQLLARLLDVEVDTAELEQAASLHREQVDEAVADSEEATEVVQALEAHADSDESDEEDVPSGEDLANEIERYLREE